jgi:hypothetical protein
MSSVEPVSRKTRNVSYRPLQSNYATDINKYILEGNNKTINARINMMRSNHTSILRIDAALIPLLEFGVNNKKKYVLHNAELPKDLSISNVVTVGVSDTYPQRPKHGDYAPAQELTIKTM